MSDGTASTTATAGRTRPVFPRRALVTAGMPYGNKDLHFGHIGGVFVQADVFARFLRDRLGPENVLFISGTDCYGSPIVERHRQVVGKEGFSGSLEDLVRLNHERQRDTLRAWHINLDLFAASGLSPYREIHEALGARLLRTLHVYGHIERRTTPQFYDAQLGTFLNGRQVRGRCPVQGCASEQAYADECSLGHQYEPRDLIDPRSALTGRAPEMRDVSNWYLRVPEMRGLLRAWLEGVRDSGAWRPFIVSSLLEQFGPPTIHVTRNQAERLDAMAHLLPPHARREGEGKSVQLVFDRLEEMEKGKNILGAHGVRYRTGKTLVPFRLTGNLAWGLPAPELEGLPGLTFWVWPESLWAPISFTIAHLTERGCGPDAWKEWWCSREAQGYQFIGEDNVYFYGLPEMAMFLGMQGAMPSLDVPEGQVRLPHLVANRHLLFLDRKASSSGVVKPPMARDLLNHYTAEQLRAHFASLGLGMRGTSFRPKPLDPNANPAHGDPVMKEGNLLSNAFNRAVRSCFYTAQKFFDGRVPVGAISPQVVEECSRAVLDYEEAMHRHEFHRAVEVAGDLIRETNQRWARAKPFADECDPAHRRQALVDAFHQVRTAIALMHPIAPEGTERVREYLRLDADFWRWDRIFEPLYAFMPSPGEHRLRFLEPRVDFFKKHPSQLAQDT